MPLRAPERKSELSCASDRRQVRAVRLGAHHEGAATHGFDSRPVGALPIAGQNTVIKRVLQYLAIPAQRRQQGWTNWRPSGIGLSIGGPPGPAGRGNRRRRPVRRAAAGTARNRLCTLCTAIWGWGIVHDTNQVLGLGLGLNQAPARPRAGHRYLAQPRSPGGVHGVRSSAARGSRDGGRIQPALATPLARSARTALLPQPLILFGHAALHHEGSRRQPARCGAEGAAG